MSPEGEGATTAMKESADAGEGVKDPLRSAVAQNMLHMSNNLFPSAAFNGSAIKNPAKFHIL